MFESMKRFWRGDEPKKEQPYSLDVQKSLIVDLAQTANDRFEQWKSDVVNGTITTDRLVWQVLNDAMHDIDEILPRLSPDLIAHLRQRVGAEAFEGDEKSVIKQYLKSKLQPKIDALQQQQSALKAFEAEQQTPIDQRIASANDFESDTLMDTATVLRNRPDQHAMLGGDILGGVYPGSERSPFILVDDKAEREESFPEEARLQTALNTVKQRIEAKLTEITGNKPISEQIKSSHRTIIAVEEAIALSREMLPTNDLVRTNKDWIGKKITLQHLLEAKAGSPSAQTIFTGYLLEKLQQDGSISKQSTKVLRGATKGQGGHAFLLRGGAIIDPAVSSESLDARTQYPDPFYNVRQ